VTTFLMIAGFVVALGLILGTHAIARLLRIRARRRKGLHNWDCDDLVDHIIDEQYKW
jgi:hypothetical protein